jgi:hypothetical protein
MQISGGSADIALACGKPMKSYRLPTFRLFNRQAHDTS